MTAQKGALAKNSYELVTVIMRQVDYNELHARKIPIEVQVSLAIQHYLKLIREGRWVGNSTMSPLLEGKVKTVSCALAKQVCDDLRDIPGRFDLHTLEAVRLYLL
jgi:hypothetical protein